MAENTKIQWADDSVSLWWGCTHRGAGCLNCYAETLTSRMHGKGAFWGPNKPRLYCKNWEPTLRKLNTKAERAGVPRVVFVNSMSDFFEDDRPLVGPKIRSGEDAGLNPIMWHGPRKRNGAVEQGVVGAGDMLMWPHHAGQPPTFVEGYRHATTGDLRTEFFQVADECPWLRLLLLTKRPENVRRMIPIKYGRRDAIVDGKANVAAWRRDNVWLGTSIACQEDADRNIPELLKCRDLCAKLFVSIEPLIGPVDIAKYTGCRLYRCKCGYHATESELAFSGGDRHLCVECGAKCAIEMPVDWVIVGGESGAHARPCNVEWIRSIVRQCHDAGVPCFVKQLGAVPIGHDGETSIVGAKEQPFGNGSWRRLSDPKGGDMTEWPKDVRVREVLS